LSRILKSKDRIPAEKNQMVVLIGAVVIVCRKKFAGHTKMQADPDAIRKLEKHLLSMGFGSAQGFPGQAVCEPKPIGFTENTLVGVDMDLLDPLPHPGIPLLPVEFDFS